MAPEPRFVPRFAAEPPQEVAPYGRWAEVLEGALRDAVDASDFEDVEFDDVHWFPDRTWHGRTYVPATARTADGDNFHPAGRAPLSAASSAANSAAYSTSAGARRTDCVLALAIAYEKNPRG